MQNTKLEHLKEKTQVQWGVNLFHFFSLCAAKRGEISPSQAQTLQQELKELAQAALGEDDPDATTKQLNQYIGMINAQMKQNTEPTHYAPFPTFSFASGSFFQSAVLDQLDMIERSLTEAAKAQLIDWENEGEYFSQVLQLFSLVESGKMKPKEGIAKLIGEIEKINKSLPDHYALPVPDLNAYE